MHSFLARAHGLRGGPTFPVDGAFFDGTNDYMTRGATLTGAADGKAGTLSFWFIQATTGAERRILHQPSGAGGSEPGVLFTAGNLITIQLQDAASSGAYEFSLSSNTALTDTASWHHVIASWDRNTAFAKIYVDGVDDTGVVVTTNANNDYTVTDWAIGARLDASNKLNGSLAEFWLDLGASLDITVDANRMLFRSPAGKPVNLGATGSGPTGSSPIVFFHLDKGESAANFATNRGTGGNFTITGALTTSATSPSD